MVCGKCGCSNPDERSFCAECDAFLDWHGVEPGTPVARPQPVQPAVPSAPPVSRARPGPSPGAGPRPAPVANGSSRIRVVADLTACIERALESGREDLVARLVGARRMLDERDLSVVVA